MTDYAYLNARVCSMRPELLSQKTVDELLVFEDVKLVTESLLDSVYGEDLAVALAEHSPVRALDVALDAGFDRSLSRILKPCCGETDVWLWTILESWDVEALKAVMRGLHAQTEPTVILAAVGPSARLRRHDLADLSELPDVKAFVDLLLTWSLPWGEVLRPFLPDYRMDGDLAPLEFALDCHRYESAYRLASRRGTRNRVALELMAAEAELTNIVMCLLAVGEESRPRLLPSPGRPSRTVLALLEVKDIGEATAILADSAFRRVLDAALPFMAEPGRLAMFERMLSRESLVLSRRLALREPLSIAVPCHFLRCKRNEIMNLRLIARGIENRIPHNAIRAGLMFPSLN